MYCLFCVVLCIVCVYMCTVLLPPGGHPIAVKYIISYHIISYRKRVITQTKQQTFKRGEGEEERSLPFSTSQWLTHSHTVDTNLVLQR